MLIFSPKRLHCCYCLKPKGLSDFCLHGVHIAYKYLSCRCLTKYQGESLGLLLYLWHTPKPEPLLMPIVLIFRAQGWVLRSGFRDSRIVSRSNQGLTNHEPKQSLQMDYITSSSQNHATAMVSRRTSHMQESVLQQLFVESFSAREPSEAHEPQSRTPVTASQDKTKTDNEGLGIRDLGLGVQGLGLRGLGIRGLGSRAYGFRVQGLEVQGLGLRGLGFRDQGCRGQQRHTVNLQAFALRVQPKMDPKSQNREYWDP